MKKVFKLLIICVLILSYSCTNKVDFHPENERIWLHRANSIEKARQYQYQYGGLEVDVFFNDSLQTFEIKHDPDEVPKLTLNEWCDALETISQTGVWFDFKNLNHDNCQQALRCLKEIRRRHHMKGRLYVESSSYDQLLPFQKEGFLVSYYIPDFNPWMEDSATYLPYTKFIQDAIDKGVNDISGFDYQYHFLKKTYPKQPKLIWTVSEDPAWQARFIETVSKDSLVEVILLPLVKDCDHPTPGF